VLLYVTNVGNLNVDVGGILESKRNVSFDMINYIKNKDLDENVSSIANKTIETTDISGDDVCIHVIIFSKKLYWYVIYFHLSVTVPSRPYDNLRES
jgi:hypothetical protein